MSCRSYLMAILRSKILLYVAVLLVYTIICSTTNIYLSQVKQSRVDSLRQNVASLRLTYRERQRVAKSVCNKHKNNKTAAWNYLKRINNAYLYYETQSNLLYCKVPKSGSSTWGYNLLRLAGVPESSLDSDVGLHKLLRKFYPRPNLRTKKKFNEALKVLVVRNPFDRILSAYRDKLESYERDLKYRNGYYYRKFGKDIVQRFSVCSNCTKTKREPTWPEFVDYLINTPVKMYDEHWKPIYLLCSPCNIHYNVIVKMETFNQDTQYIIHQLNLRDKLPRVKWLHRTNGSDAAKLKRKYYALLTESQIKKLFQIYNLDFELFGFSKHLYG